MTNSEKYSSYIQLLAKVDAMFEKVVSAYPRQFACKLGCYGCCEKGLSISNVEANFIREWIQSRPEIQKNLQNPSKLLNDANACPLLNDKGGCSIYEARPLICRSHGMPISWREIEDGDSDSQSVEHRDVCPLNFTDMELNQLENGSVLGIDRLNTILSLINRVFDEDKSELRVGLGDIAVEFK